MKAEEIKQSLRNGELVLIETTQNHEKLAVMSVYFEGDKIIGLVTDRGVITEKYIKRVFVQEQTVTNTDRQQLEQLNAGNTQSEIERLRAENQALKNQIDAMQIYLDSATMDVLRLEMEKENNKNG